MKQPCCAFGLQDYLNYRRQTSDTSLSLNCGCSVLFLSQTCMMEAFPEPPCQFKGEDIVSTCFNYGCSAGQHHLPIHHPPGLVPLKHLLPCRFPRCLPNPRMATMRHCRKKAVAVWPQADGTSDTSVLCPWWWMVTVHMGVILCLIFGLVMIGLMEMNEQYDVSIISQSNWQF